jgi:hypothetical protein
MLLDKLAKGVAWCWRRLCELGSSWTQAAKQTRWETLWDMAVRFEMMRETDRGIDEYTRRVNALHRKLQVPRDYSKRGLRFYRETSDLAATYLSIRSSAT